MPTASLGCEDWGGVEEVSREACFYGGVFPLSQYSMNGARAVRGLSPKALCEREGEGHGRPTCPSLSLCKLRLRFFERGV